MEKLTDAEIVEKFKEAYEQYKTKGDFRATVYFEVLDLIKRKDAELYVLNEALDGETVKNMRLKHEVERLKAEIRNTDNTLASLDRPITEVKHEAYKEFAERLHQNCEKYPYTLPSVLANIEITYKELTEGKREDSN